MSGPDQANQDKGFLARWSQRKQEATQPEAKPAAAPVAIENVESPGSNAAPVEDAVPEFDLSTLPKLEELTASTDISAFLRKGVPEQLRNAALRRSWALDPAIRNYVSPALEYAYDWNAPGGVPGGGELGAGVDVARLVSQIMGDPAVEPKAFDANAAHEASDSLPPDQRDPSGPLPEPVVSSVRHADDAAGKIEAASTSEDTVYGTSSSREPESATTVAPQQPLRRHGSAKPIV